MADTAAPAQTMRRRANLARGVRGLEEEDAVARVVQPAGERLEEADQLGGGLVPPQGRGGAGIKTAEVTAKTGKIIGAKVLIADEAKDEELVVISKKGQVIRCSAGEISNLSRATQGVRIMKMREGDSIASMVAL